ncbi:P-type conjugative transfer protein TrbL (plasmid) [Chlorobium phaeovibrioides]|uniref:P-type conjugative transfer protein TrbL n=1 Tax=Chlorobium phaeovibrioides TaxID=1094 RepID=A0A5M8I4Q7_CHLPH|nr:P-type conjugative transfer protein TrbL [Chlorobium phaeovibrioides]KAA6230466.1 P-type conjugative transfer protein TrbL [Chlorobium phaeovibrioides]
MDPGILTTTLNHFLLAFSSGWSNLQPAINYLIATLLGIEIVMMGLWWALGGGEQLAAVMKKILYLGFWLWIVRQFPQLANAFVGSLIQAGQIAGGGTGGGGSLYDPSNIIDYGINTTAPMVDQIMNMGITEVVNGLILALSYIMIMLAYILIAWQIFYAVLEFYLVTALVGIFLPFGFLEQTKFLAEKALGAVISSGIKLMVLAFIMAVIEPVLSTLSFSGDLTLTQIWSVLLTVGAIAFLAWNAPGVAAGLMAGSPSLSSGTAVQNMIVGGTAAALAAGGVVAATRSAVQGISGGAAAMMGKTGAAASGSGSALASSGASGASGMGSGASGASSMGSSSSPDKGPTGGGSGGGKGEGGAEKGQAPNWAKQAMHAMHSPEEARPSGGSATPKL